jgi:hypothetical protein
MAPFAAVLLLIAMAHAAVAAEPIELPLWPGPAPVGDGSVDGEGKPRITVHLPEKPTGAAAVICPGGGYGGLVTGPEGHGIAAWLCRHGIAGVVLEYRLQPVGRKCHGSTRRAGSFRRPCAASVFCTARV